MGRHIAYARRILGTIFAIMLAMIVSELVFEQQVSYIECVILAMLLHSK